MRKYFNFICLFLFVFISCNRDRDEHKYSDSSSKTDTIHNYNNEVIPPLLPDIDTIYNAKPRLHIIKDKRCYYLFDSIRSDTFNIGKRINKVFISPTGKYIACLVHIDSVDKPGLWDDNKPIPKISHEHLIVVNAIIPKIIREITVPINETDFIGIERRKNWISKSRLFFHTSDGFAVGFYFVYDAFRDSLQESYEGIGKY
jgi:hypothetical protein